MNIQTVWAAMGIVVPLLGGLIWLLKLEGRVNRALRLSERHDTKLDEGILPIAKERLDEAVRRIENLERKLNER